MRIRLIIAGSRTIRPTIADLINYTARFSLNPYMIVSGGANGVDTAARRYAKYKGLLMQEFLPEWDVFGMAAGPRRNREMAKFGDALLLIWDGESRGSASMKREMQRAGKPIFEIVVPK